MSMEPDLFAATPEELRAEMRRHGGGVPPRYPAPPIEDAGDAPYFSPVQAAEAARESGMVAIRVVPLDRLVEYADRMGML